MKISFILITLLAGTMSYAAEFKMKAHSVITLKQTEKNVFEKINEVVIASTSFKSTVINNEETKKLVNDDKMTITTGKNTIHIKDVSAGIDNDVLARIERGFFAGGVRSILVTGENFENTYYSSLEKQGIIALSNLDLKKETRKSLAISDFKCVVESEVATCAYDLEINVENNGLVIAAALATLQMGTVQN
jgi:hypothetical protein